MKRLITSARKYYFGDEAAAKYGNLIQEKLSGKTVSKRKDTAEEPGGIIYEANKLGIDMWDLLEALEGMCYEGRAREINDSTYQILKDDNMTKAINSSLTKFRSIKPDLGEADVEEYLSKNSGYSIQSTEHADLTENDVRFKEIFNSLADMGYNPRISFISDRMYSEYAIAFSSHSTKIPDDVQNLIDSQPNVVVSMKISSKRKDSYLLKVSFRDDAAYNMKFVD